MHALERFESICAAMADPAFYPHPVSRLERRDTHISAVFLTGSWVYKLKKPMDFGFLDYRSLERRRHYCEQEVRLNQRLSSGVYEGVVCIAEDAAGRLSLDGPGRVVEVAVKMRQLPDALSLRELLRARRVGPEELRRLGDVLAAFYERSAGGPEIDRFGLPEAIAFNMEENFRQVAPFVGGFIGRERWEFIREVSRAFFRDHQELFLRRVAQGRIRDGHGDLRTEHIYFIDGIEIIDCIEFNDRFRYGDVAIDLAFLHMDMEHLGHAELSRVALAAYVERSGDLELYALLDFYAAYRAVVKLKVACLHATEVDGEAAKAPLRQKALAYLEQAYRYAVQFSRPTIWVFCGLPASGKSTLARHLAEVLSLTLLQSDRLRKEEGAAGVVPYGEGAYRPEMRQRVYAGMLAQAQEAIRGGRSVALDASFSRRHWRDEVRRLAEDLDTAVLFVECRCDAALLRERLLEREATAGLSDARLEHLPEMVKHFEPLDEIPPEMRIHVHTNHPLARALGEVLTEAYTRKCAQTCAVL